MKIASHSGESSFFVSFSDVLFALMTIFVFLMVIVATQLRAGGLTAEQAAEQEAKLEAKTAALAEKEKQIQQMAQAHEEESSQLQAALAKSQKELADAVATKPINLVVMIDATGSMDESIDNLKEALREIVTEVPKVTSQLKIGVIAYREKLDEYPLTQVFPYAKDQGASANSLIRFVNSIEPKEGWANIAGAMSEGVQWLSRVTDSKAKSVYIVVGDIGPYEMRNNTRGIAEIGDENNLVASVRGLAQAKSNLSVVMLLPPVKSDSNSKQYETFTAAFFQNVVNAAGEGHGKFTRDNSAMLNHILLAILAAEKKQ